MKEIGPFFFEDHIDKDGELEVVFEAWAGGLSEDNSRWISRDDAVEMVRYLIGIFDLRADEAAPPHWFP